MSFTGDLLAGIGQLLAEQAGATWKATGSYAASDPWPVVITAVPATPDQVIVLTPYTVSEDDNLNDVVQGVQIRTRGTRDPRPVSDMNDAIFDALHGLTDLVLNGVPVVLVSRNSAAYLGVDDNGRHEHTANYYVMAARPSTHRPD